MQHLDFGAVTHRGVVRPINEDSIVAQPPVFLVADGIGGSDAGEVASGIVAGEFGRLAEAAAQGPIDSEDVAETIQRAHRAVLELSRTLPHGAASTATGCVALEIEGQAYWLVFNVGDSRVYRCSGPKGARRIKQVSVDHSLVQELVDAGALTKAETYTHPNKNVVTRAVGADEGCEPDFWMLPMQVGERFVICSDGLLGDSPAEDVRRLIKQDLPARHAADELLELALRSGARDNVSAIVIDIRPADGHGGDGDDAAAEPEEVTTVLTRPPAVTTTDRSAQ